MSERKYLLSLCDKTAIKETVLGSQVVYGISVK